VRAAAERERAVQIGRAVYWTGVVGVILTSSLVVIAVWTPGLRLPALLLLLMAGTLFVFARMRVEPSGGQVAAYAVLSVYVVSLAGASLALGGFAAGLTPWIANGPLLVAIYAGRRFGGFALALVTVTSVAMVLFVLRLDIGPYGDAPVRVILQGMGLVGASAYVLSVAAAVDRRRNMTIQEAQSINERLSRELEEHRRTRAALEAANARVADAARAAGMAEIATGVLHNLGNALTSVNVSANLLATRLDDADVARVERAIALVDERPHAAQRYLVALADRMRFDRVTLRAEVASLQAQIDHVNAVVQAQQAHARSGGVVNEVTVEALVRQALVLARRGREVVVDVDVDVDGAPPLWIESHKALQVLVNLLANAQDAVVEAGRRGSVRVRAARVHDAVEITIADDGVGIRPEHLPRLFEHGFTTKVTGNGFGLHISALVAAELGGSLQARSDGQGSGATFVLRVPVRRAPGDATPQGHSAAPPGVPESPQAVNPADAHQAAGSSLLSTSGGPASSAATPTAPGS
jgi:signal transduction histidine kinase